MEIKELVQILKDADDAGLFDASTSIKGRVDSVHRLNIRRFLREYESISSPITPQPPSPPDQLWYEPSSFHGPQCQCRLCD